MRLVPWKKLFRIAVVCSTFSLVYHLFTRYTNLIEQVALATNITLSSEDQRLIKPYIRGTCPGRLALGNVIGCFETLWAFSIRYKLQVVFPDKELAVMKKTFKNIGESVLSESEFKKLSQQGLKWRKVQNANVFFLEQESCNPTIDIEQYKKMVGQHGRKPACHPISMEENIRIEDKVPVIMAALLPFRTEITHQLEFVDSVNKEADYVIGKVGDLYSNPVFIGVHVRRTDYARWRKGKYNDRLVDSKYFNDTMNWMKRRYKNSVFLVASDDMKWCEEYLSQPGVHMVGGNSAALDFAILAKCNHSIVDYGSYSLWSAFLAGGNVITSADHQGAARSAGEMLGWKLWKFDFEN